MPRPAANPPRTFPRVRPGPSPPRKPHAPMAAVPVSAGPAAPAPAGREVPRPLFGTPQPLANLSRDGNTHSLLFGYALWAAAPLSALIGAGVYRFYYGKKVTGLIWLLTGGLLGVGWVVDLFLMPRMEERAAREYAPGPFDYNLAWLLNGLPFLGLFGVHRFYLGKWVSGIVWLLTAGLFGFGWVWDLFTLNEQVDERNRAALGQPREPRLEGEGLFGIGW